MAYTLYNTDGSILLTLGDGKVDQKSTSLTLIGRNVNSYGEYFNNNLIKLLENFANVDEPLSPMVGQMWYDTATGRMKVYDLNSIFRPVNNTLISDTIPPELSSGDFWFDTINNQLKFSTDGTELYTIGPKDAVKFGTTGWVAETISNEFGIDKTVTSLFNNDTRIGILATEPFNFLNAVDGMTHVVAGLNLNTTIEGVRFAGTATSADTVQGINVSELVKNNGGASGSNFQTINGYVIVNSDLGLSISNSTNDLLSLSAETDFGHVASLSYNTADKDFRIRVNSGGLTSALYIDSSTQNIGLWTETPFFSLDVNGTTRIRGDLIVEGTSTNITSVNLQVNDPTLELGYGQVSPNNGFVNDGGIILHGETDHTILWKVDGSGWNVNDNLNLTTGDRIYSIAGDTVVSSTALGEVITDAPGLARLGILDFLTVTNISIKSGIISAVDAGQTLYLTGNGVGTVDVNDNRITSLSAPVDDTDAATKKYIDDSLYLSGTKNFQLSLDTTNFVALHGSVDDGVKIYLDLMFPITNIGEPEFDIPDSVRAKVLCGVTSVTAPSVSFTATTSAITVDKAGIQNSAIVASGLAGAIASTLPEQTYTPSTSYTVQTWKTQIGVWTKIS